jgi:hypothetical protein
VALKTTTGFALRLALTGRIDIPAKGEFDFLFSPGRRLPLLPHTTEERGQQEAQGEGADADQSGLETAPRKTAAKKRTAA